MEATGTDIFEDGGFSFDLECRASDDDDGREGAARLRPAAVAMAKTGYDRRRRDPVTDGPTHASTRKMIGHFWSIVGHLTYLSVFGLALLGAHHARSSDVRKLSY
jgi:hypothetical protein